MIHEDPLPLASTLRAAGEITAAKIAECLPVAPAEQADVLRAIHGLDAATSPVHDQLAECLGLIGSDGRCRDCGRLVAWGMWRANTHKDGGCLMAVPFVGTVLWAKHHPEGIPLFGQWLWRHRRRRHRTVIDLNGDQPQV